MLYNVTSPCLSPFCRYKLYCRRNKDRLSVSSANASVMKKEKKPGDVSFFFLFDTNVIMNERLVIFPQFPLNYLYLFSMEREEETAFAFIPFLRSK